MKRTLIFSAALLFASAPPITVAQDKTPASLPQDVVDAWSKAGARVGWMSNGQYGAPAFHDDAPQ